MAGLLSFEGYGVRKNFYWYGRRRFVWNFFRLENEHLNNCGQFRAVRDISIVPISANDQHLLEKMMDEEDGVTNRQSKPMEKRPLLPRWVFLALPPSLVTTTPALHTSLHK